jgi:hypothetical protein
MELDITKEQFREIFINVLIGIYIREAVDELNGKDFSKLREIENFLASQAEKFGAGDMAQKFEGVLVPNDELYEKIHDEIIDCYNEDEFWNSLVVELGKRDFFETITEKEKEEAERTGWLPKRVHSLYDMYSDEFDKHGVDRLFIKK